MNAAVDKQIEGIVGVLGTITRRLETPSLSPTDRQQIERDLIAVDKQLAEKEARLKPHSARSAGDALPCPITGAPMETFRLLTADAAVSDSGLWFNPGNLQRLLQSFSVNSQEDAAQPTSLEQVILEIENEERRARAVSSLRRVRQQVEQARARLASPSDIHAGDAQLADIVREVARIKTQLAQSAEPVMLATPPNITPHPGALVSLVREGEKPCYLFAHAGSKAWMGRGAQCQIRIDNPRVSRVHCVIISAGPSWYVADLDSRNGTWVNGRRITEPTRLTHQDTVCLGGAATMIFSIISIAVKEEQFYTLAFRRLTGQATADDREELEDMLAQKSELQAEFDLLQHGALVAREVLPILAAMEATAGTLSPAARTRLDDKVKTTFRASRKDIAKAAQSVPDTAHRSPRSGQPLTPVRLGNGIELELDLKPGIHRGGVFVRKGELTRLLKEKQAGQLLAQALA